NARRALRPHAVAGRVLRGSLPVLSRAARACAGQGDAGRVVVLDTLSRHPPRLSRPARLELEQGARVRAEIRRHAAVRAPYDEPRVQRSAAAYARTASYCRRAVAAAHRGDGAGPSRAR